MIPIRAGTDKRIMERSETGGNLLSWAKLCTLSTAAVWPDMKLRSWAPKITTSPALWDKLSEHHWETSDKRRSNLLGEAVARCQYPARVNQDAATVMRVVALQTDVPRPGVWARLAHVLHFECAILSGHHLRQAAGQLAGLHLGLTTLSWSHKMDTNDE